MAGVLKADALSAYLVGAARVPFVWGTADCGLFLADWVRAVTGADPAADLRASYGAPEDAAALLGPKGLPGTVKRLARRAGLVPGIARGSIGVVRALSCASEAHCGAIFTGTGWALRQERGLLVVPAVPILTYKVPF